MRNDFEGVAFMIRRLLLSRHSGNDSTLIRMCRPAARIRKVGLATNAKINWESH